MDHPVQPEQDSFALFDGRTHHLDGPEGGLDYVRWRQADAMKNSVGMLAAHHFSHKTLTGVPVRERKAMLAEKGVCWDDLDQTVKQGTFVHRLPTDEQVTYWHTKLHEFKTLGVQRNVWTPVAAPYFDSVESLGLAG